MAPFTNYIPTIPRLRPSQANTLINLASESIKPLTRASLAWLQKKADLLRAPEKEKKDESSLRKAQDLAGHGRYDETRPRTPEPVMSIETMEVPFLELTPEKKKRIERRTEPDLAADSESEAELLVSEFIDEVVVIHVPYSERARVERELKDAMNGEYFAGAWPEDAAGDDGDRMRESAVFRKKQTDSEMVRREEVARKWKAKGEGGITRERDAYRTIQEDDDMLDSDEEDAMSDSD